MSGEESTYQLLLKVFQKLEELDKKCGELDQRLAILEPLGEDVAKLKQQAVALESAIKVVSKGRSPSIEVRL